MIKSYSELILLPTFEERFEYLSLDGTVGSDTFGFDRYLNQDFYRSKEWKQIRDYVIARDNGFDLGVYGYPIRGNIIIHHINPIMPEDIVRSKSVLLDPENLITTSHLTHNAIHYGSIDILVTTPVERKPNDTVPWRV